MCGVRERRGAGVLRMDICEHCAAKIEQSYTLEKEAEKLGSCALCWRTGVSVATYTLNSRRAARGRRAGASSLPRTTARRAEYKGNWRDFE